MKTFSFLIILPLMTLTACTQWEKPGAAMPPATWNMLNAKLAVTNVSLPMW